MIATLVSAALVCVTTPLVGQAVLRLCGARTWSWLAPSVGVAVLMLLAVPALHLPGRSATAAVALVLVVASCGVAALRDPAMRPPASGLLAAVPTALLAVVPFAASGYAGTLGVSFNNDMASHLIWAEAYGSEAIAQINPLQSGYPLGPHALVAVLAHGLGIPTDLAFAGLTLAIPVLLAWTALGALRGTGVPAQALVATVAGMPFIVAGYYAQGSFKELLQAMFVLALAVALQRRAQLAGRMRWIPVGLLIAGILSVYSVPGLAWPVAILGVWLGGLLVERWVRRRSLRGAVASLRAELAPLALGALVLAVVLLPQAQRLVRFFSATAGTNGTGIETTSLGNLAAPLPLWEAFGIWDNPDYRLPPIDAFTAGMWSAFVLALVLVGSVWWIRRGDWIVPAAAAATLLIWTVSDATQAPYVTAKALVMLSPLLMLLALRPLVERDPGSTRSPLWLRLGGFALAIVLAVAVVGSSWGALRTAKVGPRAHSSELRQLRPTLDGRPTLFLGNDDFIRWELAGVPVNAPVIGFQGIDTRPQKPWAYGEPLDVDSLEASVLDEYDWVITPRDAAASAPPDQLRLARTTRSFQLWRRVAPIEPRAVLAEGPDAAARLDCSTAVGRRAARRGGVAAVRKPTVSLPVVPIPAGAVHEARLPLKAGTWTLQASYESQHAIEVAALAMRATLPANLDRPGTRWHIGRVRLTRPGTIGVRLRVRDERMTPPGRMAGVSAIHATPVDSERLVPVREACGKLVDWLRPRVTPAA